MFVNDGGGASTLVAWHAFAGTLLAPVGAARAWSAAIQAIGCPSILVANLAVVARRNRTRRTGFPGKAARSAPGKSLANTSAGLDMDTAYMSAIAALSGSVIGGLTSLAASWVSQDAQARAQRLIQDKSRRQELYKAFIEEASRLYGNALVTNEVEIADFVALYAMVSRMRVISSLPVVKAADAVVVLILDTYFKPNKTMLELRDTMKGEHLDPLRNFGEACRDDFHQFPPI
jgi:hypothetical protein